jgi:D-arabinose 1-dehydrogenase-like Zn-dependent alcohol dehydrogenase
VPALPRTTLRNTRALPGDRVAVLGIGGLGHLGVQFSRAMGFETVEIAPAPAKPKLRVSWAPTTTPKQAESPAKLGMESQVS